VRTGTPGFAPSRLREAREARSLTIIALAELIGVSKQVVSKYEAGERSPGPDVVYRLAAALQVPPGYFTLPERVDDEGTVFFRSLAAATKGARARGNRRLAWLADIAAFLFDYVAFPEVDVPAMPGEEPERAAGLLREAWRLRDAPLPNVVGLLESRGAVVTRGSMDAPTIDAFSRWHPIGRPLLFLSSDKESAVRSRFDAAHELGHMVLHRQVPRRTFNTPERFKAIEAEATEFASAFLMPASSFVADLWSPGLESMQILKPKWGVSLAAMIMRARQLEIISDEFQERLLISRARHGWSRIEPLDNVIEVERPRLLRRSIEMLVEHEVMSREMIVSKLALNQRDVESLACLHEGYLTTQDEPVRLLDHAVPRARVDDGVRGSVLSFPRSATEPQQPASQSPSAHRE